MAAPAYLTTQVIQQLVKLEGRALVTFPYADNAHARVERIQKLLKTDWLSSGTTLVTAFETADEEWTDAKLFDQHTLGEDDQHVFVYRRYEEITGLLLTTLTINERGDLQTSTTQRVDEATQPAALTLLQLADSVAQSNALVATQTKASVDAFTPLYRRVPYRKNPYGSAIYYKETASSEVAPTGQPDTPAGPIISSELRQTSKARGTKTVERVVFFNNTGGGSFDATASCPIYTSENRDAETGVLLCTDHFIHDNDYALPALGAEQKKSDGAIGYSATSFSPARYVNDARKVPIEDSPRVMIEIDYSEVPAARADDVQAGFVFPALFAFNPWISAPVGDSAFGKYAPPWPGNPNSPEYFQFIAHRQNVQCGRRYRLYSLGRTDLLPPVYSVQTPGTASKLFAIIEPRTIHAPIQVYERLTDGGGTYTFLVEDIPASTPATYNPNDILVASAEEKLWKGNIYCREVVFVSEATPLANFPDVATVGYYTATRSFLMSAGSNARNPVYYPNNLLAQPSRPKPLYFGTGGAQTQTGIVVYGLDANGAPHTGTVSAKPSPDAACTTDTYSAIYGIGMPTALSTDTITAYGSVDPDTASLRINSVPPDGDKLVVGMATPVAATGTLVTTGNFTAFTPETVAVGGKTYTFTTPLGGNANDVLVGANTAASLTNLSAAINHGAGSGTLYNASTTANANVTSTVTTTVLTATAIVAGSVGNAIATAENCAHASWTQGTGLFLTGGSGVTGASPTTYRFKTTPSATHDINLTDGTPEIIRDRIYNAVLGNSSYNTTANADITAARDPASRVTVDFSRLSYTSNGVASDYILEARNGADAPGQSWGTVSAWDIGGLAETIATIPPGANSTPAVAFFSQWLTNSSLNRASYSAGATPNLIPSPVSYSDWIPIPSTTALRLIVNVAGTPKVRVAYQLCNDIAAAAATYLDVATGLVSGAVTITSGGSNSYAGMALTQSTVGSDTIENEVVSSIALLRAWLGTTASHTMRIQTGNGAAFFLANFQNAGWRQFALGNLGYAFIRLKFTQPYTALKMRAVHAHLEWEVMS